MIPERLVKELQQRLHLQGYQLADVAMYIQWAYVAGYDDARIEYAKMRNASKCKPVIAVDTLGNPVGKYPSIAEAAKVFKVHFKGISRAITHHYKCAGHYWRYAT